MNWRSLNKSIFYGLVGSSALLVFYFSILTFVSGWRFTQEQFSDYWYYIVSLAAGFGVQVSLYAYLRDAVRQRRGTEKVLIVSGATSTVAMISCCAHYVVNILPILGISGAMSIIAQYQIQFFWVGLAFNAGGILFITRKIFMFKKSIV